ncbi:MAG: hypothetical protein ACP5UA_12630 [Candidatus Hydrogenedens sp.]
MKLQQKRKVILKCKDGITRKKLLDGTIWVKAFHADADTFKDGIER